MSTRNRWMFLVVVFMLIAVQQGLCGMPCSDLKAKIDDGLKAKGVQNYTLTVVPNADTTTAGKTVGSCDGGTQKIVYSREAAAAAAPDAGKPAPATPKAEKKPPAATK